MGYAFTVDRNNFVTVEVDTTPAGVAAINALRAYRESRRMVAAAEKDLNAAKLRWREAALADQKAREALEAACTPAPGN